MTTVEDNCELESSKSKIILEIDAFPFKGLKISDGWKQLDSIQGRSVCASCKKSRKYFCYTCYIPVLEVQHVVPKIKLPIKIDIIKHAREMDGKSTAVHAAVLAPDDVRIFTYPCMPDYSPQENVVLIYPNKDAVSVEEACERVFRKVSEEDGGGKRVCTEASRQLVHRAVFIDSTWNQSRGIFKDPRIKALPSVVLKSRLSQFWRHQADSPRWYLATIEAIHQFLVELDQAQTKLTCCTAGSGSSPLGDNTRDFTNHKEDECSDSVKSGAARQDNLNVLSDISLQSPKVLECSEQKQSDEAAVSSTSGLIDCIKEEASDNTVVSKEDGYSYRGQYDNLLFFFRYMYSKIHTLYDHEQLRSYKRRLE